MHTDLKQKKNAENIFKATLLHNRLKRRNFFMVFFSRVPDSRVPDRSSPDFTEGHGN